MTVSLKRAAKRARSFGLPSPFTRLGRGTVALAAALTLVAGTAAAAVAYDGIDVSRYQHPNGTSINWSQVKAQGIKYAFIKATEGSSYTNTYFAGDWAATRSVGLYHGAYHFARPSIGTAAKQARYFISKAGPADQPGDLPPVLDLEVSGGLTVSQLRTWVKNWLVTVEDLTGRKPIIYTGPYFWKTYMGNSTAFTAYPLWIAHYTTGSPTVPGGWPTWTFWQGTSSGKVQGISGSVDMNTFNGTSAQLAALAQVSTAPAPAPSPSPTPTPTGPTQPKTTVTPTAVTLALSSTSVYAGQSVTFSGDLTTDTGQPIAGRTAVLRTRPAGQTTWSRVAGMPTDAAGHFATTMKVTTAASYKVTVAATDTYARAVSPIRSLSITPKTTTKITLTAGRTTIRKGTDVKLYGHLTTTSGSALVDKPVRYYVRPAGSTRWTLVGSDTSVAPTGWHQLYAKPRRTSTYKAVYRGGLEYTSARSTLVKVVVR